MIKRWLVVIVTGLAAVGLGACGGDSRAQTREPGAPVAVRVATVEATQEPDRLELSGELVSSNRFEVASKIAGRVLELPVAEGDRVKRGDLLVRLHAPELTFAAEQARAGEEAARVGWETAVRQADRFQRLAEGEVVTPRDLELVQLEAASAKAAYQQAQAGTRMSEANLSYAALRAPHDGIVVRRPARVGDLASPGKPLMVLDDDRDREVRVTLPARLGQNLQRGGRAEVRVDNLTVDAVVDRVSPAATGQTVEAFLKVSGLDIPTGSFVRAVLLGNETMTSLRPPDSSLVRRGPLTGVFTVREGHAVLRWLRLAGDGRVLSGLEPGDHVVISPPLDLLDGMPVEVAP